MNSRCGADSPVRPALELSMNKAQIGLGIVLGAGIGTALGVASGHVGLWLSIGIAIGIVIGSRTGRNACAECASIHQRHQKN